MQLVDNVYLPDQIADTTTSSTRSSRPSSPTARGQALASAGSSTSYLNDVAVRHGRRPDRVRRRRRLADVLQQAGLAARPRPGRAARRAAAGALGLQPVHRTRARPRRAATRCSQAMVQSRLHHPGAGRRRRRVAAQVAAQHDLRGPAAAVRVRLRQAGADRQRFGARRRVEPGRPQGLHDDRPRQAAGGARRRSSTHEGAAGRPGGGRSVSIDPSNGHILAMATSSSYDQTNVRLRHPGPPADRVGVQGVRADDADPRLQRRPEPDLLQLARAVARAGCPGYPTYHVQTAEHTYQGNINVTKATTLSDNTVFAQLDADVGPGQGRRDGPRDGDHVAARLATRPRSSAACGSASRRSRWPTPTRRSPTAASTSRRPRSPRSCSPTAAASTSATRPASGCSPTARRTPPPRCSRRVITERHRHRGQLRLPGRRQDRNDEQLHRRLVRRLHAAAVDRGVGRLPERDDLDDDVNGLGPGFGGTLAAPIWHDYMQQASDGYCGDFAQPDGPVARARRSSASSRRPATATHRPTRRRHQHHRDDAERRHRHEHDRRPTRTTTTPPHGHRHRHQPARGHANAAARRGTGHSRHRRRRRHQ